MIRASVIPTRRPSLLPGLLVLVTVVVALMAAWHLMQVAAWHIEQGTSAAQYEAGYQAGVESFSDVIGGAYATGLQAGMQTSCQRGAPL